MKNTSIDLALIEQFWNAFTVFRWSPAELSTSCLPCTFLIGISPFPVSIPHPLVCSSCNCLLGKLLAPVPVSEFGNGGGGDFRMYQQHMYIYVCVYVCINVYTYVYLFVYKLYKCYCSNTLYFW